MVGPGSGRADGAHADAGAYLHAESGQVVAEGLPQGGVVVVVGDVEQESFGRAHEVGVEHGDQFAGGEVVRIGEEGACEHLEGEVACVGGEAQSVQERGGRFAVVMAVGVGEADAQQLQGGGYVDLRQGRECE